MKVLASICLMFIATMCVAQEKGDTAIKKNDDRPGPSATGVIVHRSNKNCSTVIMLLPIKKDTVYFLPVSNGLEGFDKEGTKITFKYRRSMIRQPMGCTGTPVMLWDVKAVVSTKHHKKVSKTK
jgi:hypothetical protein